MRGRWKEKVWVGIWMPSHDWWNGSWVHSSRVNGSELHIEVCQRFCILRWLFQPLNLFLILYAYGVDANTRQTNVLYIQRRRTEAANISLPFYVYIVKLISLWQPIKSTIAYGQFVFSKQFSISCDKFSLLFSAALLMLLLF